MNTEIIIDKTDNKSSCKDVVIISLGFTARSLALHRVIPTGIAFPYNIRQHYLFNSNIYTHTHTTYSQYLITFFTSTCWDIQCFTYRISSARNVTQKRFSNAHLDCQTSLNFASFNILKVLVPITTMQRYGLLFLILLFVEENLFHSQHLFCLDISLLRRLLLFGSHQRLRNPLISFVKDYHLEDYSLRS